MSATGERSGATPMSATAVDTLVVAEIVEAFDCLREWLAVDDTAASAYDTHIGQRGAVIDLHADLIRLASALLASPTTTPPTPSTGDTR